MADVVAAGDLADRLAVALATFDRALLMFGRFQLAAEFDPLAVAILVARLSNNLAPVGAADLVPG